jgi:ketosteroid isomerase-like protein
VSPADTATATSAAAELLAKEWVAAFAEGWQAPGGADAFAAHFRPLLSADVRLIQPQLPTSVGRLAFQERFAKPIFALIPDLRGEVERWAAYGDTIYIELTLRGTLAGRQISWRACDRVTLRNGVAVERESYCDPLPLLVAVACTPRAWPRFLRLRARILIDALSSRRRR